MIEILNKKLLNKDDYLFLKSKIDTFKINDTPNYKTNKPKGIINFYNREFISSENQLIKFQIKLISYINKKYKISTKVDAIWINKVDTESNKNDEYHNDLSDFTYICYLNDDYIGGEFEYNLNGEIKIIKPKKYMSILQNKNLLHRVKPVKKGERYSLIVFLKYINKENKSLI